MVHSVWLFSAGIHSKLQVLKIEAKLNFQIKSLYSFGNVITVERTFLLAEFL